MRKKSKSLRLVSGDGEFFSLLPDHLIQDIQSFMTRKEAVQTTVLSKTWYRAWSTRPIVDLDYRRFRRNAGDQENPDAAQIPIPVITFKEHARRTLTRYEELNLKIETFKLCMETAERDQRFLASELISRAARLGAQDIEFGFTFTCAKKFFILPHEVLVSQNLVRLSANGCTIKFGPQGKVNCPRLRFLGLRQVYVQGGVIWDIINRCPLIEKLLLSECKFMYDNSTNRTKMTRTLDLSQFGLGRQITARKPLTHHVFYHLDFLLLSYVKIEPLFIRDFSSKFPCLKQLTLAYCLGPKKIHIRSRSLVFITISQTIMLRARIVVPNLRRFTLSSCHIPALSFGPVLGEWESFIYTGTSRFLDNSWFHQFKKFVSVMSDCKLTLVLYLSSCWQDSFKSDEIIKHSHVVENITINVAALASNAFWDGLFWSCRPKFITTTWSPKNFMPALEAAYSRLITVVDECCFANRNKFAQSDLKDVDLQMYDAAAGRWKFVAWKTLLEAPMSVETEYQIRFRLEYMEQMI